MKKFEVIGQDSIHKLFDVLNSTFKEEFPQKFIELESIIIPSIKESENITEDAKTDLLQILNSIPK